MIKAKVVSPVVAAMTNSIDKYYLDWGFEIAPSPKHFTRIFVYTWKFHIILILFQILCGFKTSIMTHIMIHR